MAMQPTFAERSTAAAGDPAARRSIQLAVIQRHDERRRRIGELPDARGLMDLASGIRQHSLDHLDFYLDQLKSAVEQRGGVVHYAGTGDDARQIVGRIAEEGRCRTLAASQSVRTVEVDLAGLLERGTAASDIGVTGASFLIAATGEACVIEEDDAVRDGLRARVLVAIAGIDRVIPRIEDLAVMLKLLGRSAGRPVGGMMSLHGGPRGADEQDGPEAFHLVLLDNGRSDILAGAYRQALRCIDCGACSNACPVYRAIGSEAYGNAYAGPIGAVLSPLLFGLDRHGELPWASTLCSACAEVCPVRIDLPALLVALRHELVKQGHMGLRWRMSQRMRVWAARKGLRNRIAGGPIDHR